jgi:hypothetical protein
MIMDTYEVEGKKEQRSTRGFFSGADIVTDERKS